MNQEKAREFFSAYYEGTLEAGLRQTFEQRLRADAQLQSEYASFEETMSQLDTLKFEEIEIPSFLSDRIATRLEAVQDKQAAKTPAWTIWLRGLAFGGVACLALLGAVLSLNNRASGPTQAGSLVTEGDTLSVEIQGSGVTLRYQAKDRDRVVISSNGNLLREVDLDANQKLMSPLKNEQPETATFEVKTGEGITYISVPGTRRPSANTGQGTLEEFSAALAGYYRTPVELDVDDPSKGVSWNFESGKALDDATATLRDGSYSVSEAEGGVIQIQDR